VRTRLWALVNSTATRRPSGGELVALGVGQPDDEPLAPQPAQIVGGLATAVGRIQQRRDQSGQVQVVNRPGGGGTHQRGQDGHDPWVPKAQPWGMQAVVGC
jgi:hypothetical protein